MADVESGEVSPKASPVKTKRPGARAKLVISGRLHGGRKVPPNVAKKAPRTAQAGVHKKRRWRPGTVALRDIRKLQRSTDHHIPFIAMWRMMREVLQEMDREDYRVSPNAVLAAIEASEMHLNDVFQDAYDITLARNQETLRPSDVEIARRIRGDVPRYTPTAVLK